MKWRHSIYFLKITIHTINVRKKKKKTKTKTKSRVGKGRNEGNNFFFFFGKFDLFKVESVVEFLLLFFFEQEELETARIAKWPRFSRKFFLSMKYLFQLLFSLRNFWNDFFFCTPKKMKSFSPPASPLLIFFFFRKPSSFWFYNLNWNDR